MFRAAREGFPQSASPVERNPGSGGHSVPCPGPGNRQRLHIFLCRAGVSEPTRTSTGWYAAPMAACGTAVGRGTERVRITTPAARANGCGVSSTAPLLRCGNSSATEREDPLEDALLPQPKASAREFHPSNRSRPNGPLLALQKHSRVLRHRRSPADCFGANPVASALGSLVGRDSDLAVRTYHLRFSTTHQLGTFYLAGVRNFLFGSDTS